MYVIFRSHERDPFIFLVEKIGHLYPQLFCKEYRDEVLSTLKLVYPIRSLWDKISKLLDKGIKLTNTNQYSFHYHTKYKTDDNIISYDKKTDKHWFCKVTKIIFDYSKVLTGEIAYYIHYQGWSKNDDLKITTNDSHSFKYTYYNFCKQDVYKMSHGKQKQIKSFEDEVNTNESLLSSLSRKKRYKCVRCGKSINIQTKLDIKLNICDLCEREIEHSFQKYSFCSKCNIIYHANCLNKLI